MRLKKIVKYLKMKKILTIICLPLILFTACNSNDGTNALPDNNKTEISDTLDEKGNHGEYIRNSYTIYDNTKKYQQYDTYCDVDEHTYSNGFRKYMLSFNFRYNNSDTSCFNRFIFYEGELPYLLKLYKSRYEESKDEFLRYYNNKNFLPEEFDKILRERILEND